MTQDDEDLKRALLKRLDACFCDDIGHPECERCRKIRELLALLERA